MTNTLHAMIAAARAGAAAILPWWNAVGVVSEKEDGSPVTAADRDSHTAIKTALADALPEIPMISEEGRVWSDDSRSNITRFFLVDPLDGTKSFAAGHPDFCVSIGLIENNTPTLGVIVEPLTGILHYGGPGFGAFRLDSPTAAPTQIHTHQPDQQDRDQGVLVIQNRATKTPRLDAFLQGVRVRGRIAVGSALKFCLMAEGAGTLYACLHPTYEWDAAGGHAIVQGAGGRVTDLDDAPLRYNKPGLLNPNFVVRA